MSFGVIAASAATALGAGATTAAIVGAGASFVGSRVLGKSGGGGGGGGGADALTQQQAAIAQDQWDRWKELYAPLEDEFVNESKGLGSSANQNHNAQKAAADVASGFSKVREQLNDVPVNSPDAKLREENRINLAEAATSAAAQSGARETTRAAGRAGMTDAISLGRNLPAQASTGLQAASAGMASAARYAQERADKTAAGIGKMVGGITQSKGFQDWISRGSTNPGTGVSASVVPDATPSSASGFGGGGVMDELNSYGVF